MSPGLNLNQTCMPLRPCTCSTWATYVTLRFSAAIVKKGYLNNSTVLTSDRNIPITLEKVHFLTLGPDRNFSLRSYKKTDSASVEFGFSDDLSWLARSFRHLTTTPGVFQARNTRSSQGRAAPGPPSPSCVPHPVLL